MKRRTRIILALAAALLALAACSGGDGASTPPPAADMAAPVEPQPSRFTAVEEAERHGVEITGPTGHDEDQAPEFTGLTKWLNSPPPHHDGAAG